MPLITQAMETVSVRAFTDYERYLLHRLYGVRAKALNHTLATNERSALCEFARLAANGSSTPVLTERAYCKELDQLGLDKAGIFGCGRTMTNRRSAKSDDDKAADAHVRGRDYLGQPDINRLLAAA